MKIIRCHVLLFIQIERYNALLNEIRQSLTDLEKGIQGLVVMSSELEDIFTCLYEARVPPSWSTVSKSYHLTQDHHS